MNFSDSPSGQIMLKSAKLPMRAASYVKKDGREAAVLIVDAFLQHPTKFIFTFMYIVATSVISFRHPEELKIFMDTFNPF